MHQLFSLSLLLICFAVAPLNAQRQFPAVYEDAAALTARYNLDNEQQADLEKILEQRENNFEAIEGLRSSNEVVYWQKRKNIYLGEQASIRMILTTKAQLETYARVRRDIRIQENELIRSLISQGHNKQEARLLLLQQKY